MEKRNYNPIRLADSLQGINKSLVNKFGKMKMRAGWVLMEGDLKLVQKKDWLGYP